MKKVVKAEAYNNLTGKDMWRLTLACGHVTVRPLYVGGKRKLAPKSVKCWCERQTKGA